MTDRTESAMSIVAALLILFTAMLDSRVSAGLAVVLLIAYGIYKWLATRKTHA